MHPIIQIFMWIVVIVFMIFTFVIFVGAPFLPTLKVRIPDALDLCGLKKGETLIELGSGDGRILRAAAARGIYAIGYELNPLLVLYSRIRSIKHRDKVKVIWGNYWHKQWPDAQAIFVFLLQPYMQKLDTKIMQNYPNGITLVSFAFTLPNKKPLQEKNGMYVYQYRKQLKNTKQ